MSNARCKSYTGKYLCGSFLVRPNTFLNQKSSYLCVLVDLKRFELSTPTMRM